MVQRERRDEPRWQSDRCRQPSTQERAGGRCRVHSGSRRRRSAPEGGPLITVRGRKARSAPEGGVVFTLGAVDAGARRRAES